MTDRLLEPLLGGVYAGRSRELSFEAVAPELFARARAGGSLLGHARPRSRPGRAPVFAGLVGGVHGLVAALLADLRAPGADLRTGDAPRPGAAPHGAGWRLDLGAATETLDVDAVVLGRARRPPPAG